MLFEEVKSLKDFTLNCIIPEVLYEMCSKTKGKVFGLAYLKDSRVTVYYSKTYLRTTWVSSSDITPKLNRTELKQVILNLSK
jgi:hypothetical protein